MLPDRERKGGSRAQVDLVEATLLRAYLNAGFVAEARHLLADRRPLVRTFRTQIEPCRA
jgi:hypothetical protein